MLDFHEVCKAFDIDMAPQSNKNARMEIGVCACVGIEIVISCVAYAGPRSYRVPAFPSMTNLVIMMSNFATLEAAMEVHFQSRKLPGFFWM